MEYRDDYPDRTGMEWEEAMDAVGHTVTSHLHESGPCAACGIGQDDGARCVVHVDLTDGNGADAVVVTAGRSGDDPVGSASRACLLLDAARAAAWHAHYNGASGMTLPERRELADVIGTLRTLGDTMHDRHGVAPASLTWACPGEAQGGHPGRACTQRRDHHGPCTLVEQSAATDAERVRDELAERRAHLSLVLNNAQADGTCTDALAEAIRDYVEQVDALAEPTGAAMFECGECGRCSECVAGYVD